MASFQQCYDEASIYARRAVAADQQGDKSLALSAYSQAAVLLEAGAKHDPDRERAAARAKQAQSYSDRARQLDHLQASHHVQAAVRSTSPRIEPIERTERRGDRCYRTAREHHEVMHWHEAQKQYEQAKLIFISAAERCNDPSDQLRLIEKAELAKMGSQQLKTARMAGATTPHTDTATAPPQTRTQPPVTSVAAATPSPKVVPGERLTADELAVLMHTSHVNGRVYKPWIAQDVSEPMTGPIGGFQDRHGLLELSAKQKSAGAVFARPSQLSSKPMIVKNLSSKVVKQTLVSDCSFVSALAISADYERRFQRRLITKAIYPQNAREQPVYNPHGKYMLRLHFNGVWRKVIIDDQLPARAGGKQLLCSYSSHEDEFWISLLEKAYLKVMAYSYAFPGSNSSVDLHTMTGWIPDRLKISQCDNSMFSKLFLGLHKGEVLLTVATGDLDEATAERAGLVPSHAYALLDIREVEGERLVKLKNPWAHLRWRGSYSPFDERNWTATKRRALNYDLEAARKDDDGEFWIDWKSLSSFFEVIYLNWNPERFVHHQTHHRCWRQDAGPVKDLYNMEFNPQYHVQVDAGDECELWVLLSRHITQIADFADNQEYIGVHVFDGHQRIYYPEKHVLQAVKINSPHYLAKLKVPKGKQNYTLVVSQFEKANTLYFSLKTYCTHPIKVKPLPNPYPESTRVIGKWEGSTAGGCPNQATFDKNPKFALQGPGSNATTTKVLLKIEAPRQYSVGMVVSSANGDKFEVPVYRPGFAYLELELKGGQAYSVIPSTFQAGQEGTFFLTAAANVSVKLKAIN